MMQLEAPCLFLAGLQDQQAIQKEHQELKNRKNAQPLAPPSPSESVSWHKQLSDYGLRVCPSPAVYTLPSFAATEVHTAPAKETPLGKGSWPAEPTPLAREASPTSLAEADVVDFQEETRSRR